MSKSVTALLFCAGSILAQSSDHMSTPRTTAPSASSLGTNAISTTTAVSPTETDTNWITSDPRYNEYLSMGMKTAAASYAVEQFWQPDDTGNLPLQANDEYILEHVASHLNGVWDSNDNVNRYSIEGYFITVLPPKDQQYQSSFISVWESLQGITPVPTMSAQLHSFADQYLASTTMTTGTSRADAQGTTHANLGIVTAMLVAVAGFFW